MEIRYVKDIENIEKLPYSTEEDTNEYRLKKTKDGEFVLQRLVIIKKYDKDDEYIGGASNWKDLETV